MSILDALDEPVAASPIYDEKAATITGGKPEGKSAGRRKPVVVVSFNLNEKADDADKREDVALILESMRADVICLQEVSNPQSLIWLARRLKMYHRLSAMCHGTTIITRHPIARVRRHIIPESYFNALVAVEVGGIWYASIHLNSESYKRDEKVRIQETDWLLKRFRPRRGVMAGDWNSVSHLDNDTVYKTLTKSHTPLPPRAILPSHLLEKEGWIDAGSGGSAASTWMQAKPGEIERIDRIYYRAPAGSRWRAVRSAVLGPRDFPFLKERSHGAWPTGRDHRLVTATFATKKRK